MYIPFSAYIGGVPTGTISYCRIYINSTGDAEGNSVTAGAPLYVRKEGVNLNGVPSYTTIVLTGQQPVSQVNYDLNGDGVESTFDLVFLRNILLFGGEADLNGDGLTYVKDLIKMKKYFANRI